MDLMPHITALLDDLIAMTDKITVKREDIAIRYDTDTDSLALYNQYREILNGDTSFFTYYKYPAEVLRKYTKWVEKEASYSSNYGALVPLNGSSEYEKHISNNRSVIISSSAPGTGINNMRKAGDGWIQYTGKNKFFRIHDRKAISKDLQYKIYKTREDGSINYNKEIPGIMMPGNISTLKNRTLYLYDQIYDKYIPVNIYFETEYQEYDPDTFSIDPNWSYHGFDMATGKIETLFVTNESFDGEYIVYEPNIYPDIELQKKFCLRYKIYLTYAEKFYYDSEVYKPLGSIEDNDTRYIRIDTMEYYLNNGTYLPLYEELSLGDYYYNDKTKSYDSVYMEIAEDQLQSYLDDNKEVFIYRNNDYFTYSEGDIGPFYIVKPEADGLARYEKVSDSDMVFYYYIDRDANKVSNYLDNVNDPTSWRYAIDSSDELKLFYGFEDPEEENICKISITSTEIPVTWATIVQVGVDGEGNNYSYEIYIDVADYKRYYLHTSASVTEGLRYSEVTDDKGNILYFEVNSNGHYALSEKEVDGGIPCFFTNDNIKVYQSEVVFTAAQINTYSQNRSKIPAKYHDILKELMEQYVISKYCPNKGDANYAVPIYYGETNNYYRELNGMPPLNSSVGTPKINRKKINPYYTGDSPNCYVFELTDSEVLLIEEKGILDQYKKTYPNATYLNYLGRNRIDVVDAREAAAYDILLIGDADMTITKTMFAENYKIARNYILNMQYHPELFGEHEYYHAYIGFTICVLAMILCMTKSGDILIQNKFMDQKTVDNIFRSFGFNGTFDSIPFIYRRNIARNIYSLIRNKGIDAIYDKVIKLFNIDAEVYKYYFKKVANRNTDGSIASIISYDPIANKEELFTAINADILYIKEGEEYKKVPFDDYESYKETEDYTNLYMLRQDVQESIVIAQSPINSGNVIKDIIDASNELNYDDITSADQYWGVYQSDESVKQQILDSKFNYMDSKYITLNNKFSLTELNFNSAYLLNYFLEATKFNNNNSIEITVDHIENPQLIQDLIITVFAINAIKFGFDGNIPNDIISAASIYKFNLDTEIVDENTGEIKKIIDMYLDYMSQSAAISLLEVEQMVKDISTSTKGSIESPIYNDKTDNSVTDIVKTYMKNIDEDEPLTMADENSLYNKIVSLRENAKTITDFRCFNDLLTCISVCEETSKAYKLDNPIWEPMYTVNFNRNQNRYVRDESSEKINYTDIRVSWDLLPYNDKKVILESLNSDIYYKLISYDPELNSDYVKISVYESEPDEYEIVDKTEYYQPFIGLGNNQIVTTKRPGIKDYNDKEYVICIYNLTREELVTTPIVKLINKIDIYRRTDLLTNDIYNYEDYINTLLSNDIYGTNLVRPTEYKNIGNNNIAYIGNNDLNTFITKGYNLEGPVIYIEAIKNPNTTDDVYTLTIYRKCDSALSYYMYLREKAPEIYEYLQIKTSETDEEYVDRMNEFSSAIIATIEDNIESDTIKENLNLSYVDFSNVSSYIKLIINVFKSYTVDLSSMDTIYTVDDKSKNRVKIIESYYTDESYGIKSNLHIEDKLASHETYYKNDYMRIKDEVYIEFYARQFIDIDNDSIDTYYRISNTLFSDDDYRVSAYAYTEGLRQSFYVAKDVDKLIGREIL